jgi:hypothetical protein
MQIAAPATPSPSSSTRAAAPVAVPHGAPTVAPEASIEADELLVQGLRLPKIPGLPGAGTPGIGLGDLVGPPAPGSVAAKADMAVVKGAQRMRTRAGDEWARRMDSEGALKVWTDLARRHRESSGAAQGWLGTALLASTLASNAAVTQLAKRRYARPRPYVVDPKITPVVSGTHARSSYPSGHASSAFAAARVISQLAPELSREAYSIATQVAVSRVYAGVHFPSDVVAGALLGTGVADAALRVVRRDLPVVAEPVVAAAT